MRFEPKIRRGSEIRVLRRARTEDDAFAQVRHAGAMLGMAGMWIALLSVRAPLFAACAGASLLASGYFLGSRPRATSVGVSLLVVAAVLPFVIWRAVTPFPGEGLDPQRDLTYSALRAGPITFLAVGLAFVARAALVIRRFPRLRSRPKSAA